MFQRKEERKGELEVNKLYFQECKMENNEYFFTEKGRPTFLSERVCRCTVQQTFHWQLVFLISYLRSPQKIRPRKEILTLVVFYFDWHTSVRPAQIVNYSRLASFEARRRMIESCHLTSPGTLPSDNKYFMLHRRLLSYRIIERRFWHFQFGAAVWQAAGIYNFLHPQNWSGEKITNPSFLLQWCLYRVHR